MNFEDNKLLSGCSRQLINSSTFEILYQKHWKDMYALSYYYLNDEELAKEHIQDIFKSIWERRNELIINVPVSNYLFRCVKLKVAEHYRTKAAEKEHLKRIIDKTDKPDHSTEHAIMLNDLKAEISKLVNLLPMQCRKVYLLSREQGLSINEISNRLVISEKTVKNHLTKALGHLRTRLRK